MSKTKIRPGKRNPTLKKGTRFGALTIIKPKVRKSAAGKWYAKVKCDCGVTKEVQENNLTSNNSTRCSRSCSLRSPAWNKLSPGAAARNNRFSRYKTAAQTRGFIFEITLAQFTVLTAQNCYYCGSAPSNVARITSRNGVFIYSGLDRVNNELGYIPSNVVPCCRTCNYCKGARSSTDFLNWISQIYKRRCNASVSSRIK